MNITGIRGFLGVTLVALACLATSTVMGAESSRAGEREGNSQDEEKRRTDTETGAERADPSGGHFTANLISPTDEPVYYFVGDTILVRLTARRVTGLHSVRLLPLGLANSVFDSTSPCQVAGVVRTEGADEYSLDPGNEVLVTCFLEPKAGNAATLYSLFSGSRKAGALIQIERAASENTAWEADRIEFATKPLFVSPVSGAIVGAAILGLFSGLVTRSGNWKTLLVTMSVGVLVAVILIFGLSALSAGDSGQGLPVNVQVTDFQGGFIVGLMAHLMRDYLAGKLGIVIPTSAVPPPPQPQPPNPNPNPTNPSATSETESASEPGQDTSDTESEPPLSDTDTDADTDARDKAPTGTSG